MLKKPLPYKEQVAKLKEHGMIVPDETYAEDKLKLINYYRFTGYALQYRKSANDSDYIEGTVFDTIALLYEFDAALRDMLRTHIETVEVYYRTVISHEFSMAKCVDAPHDQHYDARNYVNKKGFSEIQAHFNREKSYYKDSLIMKHHHRKYGGKMPLWVIVEMMSMSDVSKLYSCMYYNEQDRIADVAGVNRGQLKNNLHCVSVLRNKCSHAARLYNTTFYPSADVGINFMRNNPTVKNDTLFSYIVVLVKRLPLKAQKKKLVNDLVVLLAEYENVIDLDAIGFPTNWSKVLWNQTH